MTVWNSRRFVSWSFVDDPDVGVEVAVKLKLVGMPDRGVVKVALVIVVGLKLLG